MGNPSPHCQEREQFGKLLSNVSTLHMCIDTGEAATSGASAPLGMPSGMLNEEFGGARWELADMAAAKERV
jgi:hypothetical protein